MNGICKFDIETKQVFFLSVFHNILLELVLKYFFQKISIPFARGDMGGEFVFVADEAIPAEKRAEDDGWLIGFQFISEKNNSEVCEKKILRQRSP